MKQKGKRKPDWLDGDRQQVRTDAVREAMAIAGFHWPEHEIEKLADQDQLQEMEQTAHFPEGVLQRAKQRVVYIKKKVVNPHRGLDPARREKARTFFIEERGLSARDADRECDKVEVISRPTLRCIRDAQNWLDKAKWAIQAGRKIVADAKTAKGKIARQVACMRAEQEFSRAVSFAFYAGNECAELKARASFDQKFGGDEKSKRQGQFSKLREVTFAEYRKHVGAERRLTNDDLRDAVAQPANGITYRDGCFHWTDTRGRKKKTSNRRWENIVADARKSITVYPKP